MKKIFALLVLCTSTLLFSQENKTITYDLESEIPKDTTAIRGELQNGLKYYIKENNRPKNEINMRLVVKVGHLQEDDNQQGLAHLLEHMGFNGTKNFKKDKLIKYLESIGMTFGADLNAHTGFEETVYKLKVPSSNLKKVNKAFQILEDWAHNMSLKDEAINAERPVVLEEFRARLGSGNRVGTEVAEFMYEGMPQLRYFSDEKLENIKNFDTKHIRRFYNDWYRPNLMGIIISGDIDPAYAEKKIKKHFSKLVNPENEKTLFAYDSVPYHKKTRVKIVTDPEKTTTGISLDFININPNKKEKALMRHQKEGFVKGMMSSMLNKRLNELSVSDTPPFIGAGAGVGGTLSSYHQKFSIGASSSEAGIHQALEAMIKELERVKRFGFTKDELAEVKKNMLASNETFLENKDDWYSSSYLGLLASEFDNSWVLYDKNWRYNFYKTVIPQITLEEINAQFDFYYHKDNRVLVLTAPEKEDLVLPTEKELLATIKKATLNTDIEKYVPKKLDNQIIKNLRPKGTIVSEQNHLYDIKEMLLSNGVKVYYKKTDFDKESIRFKAFSFGGTSLLSDKDYLAVGQLMSLATVTGIGGYKSHELQKVLAGKKVRVSTNVSTYYEGLRGSARAKDFETLFKLIYLNFTSVNKDEKMYASFKDKIKVMTKNRKLKPSSLFSSEIAKVTQKGNPRYINMNENNNLERLLDSVSYDDIYEKYTERFKNAGDFNFFFIGDFDEAELKKYAEMYLGSLPSSEEKEDYVLTTYKNIPKGEEIIVHKGIEDKATLIMSFITEAKSNRKEVDAIKIFAQIFKTRLRNQIREEKGGVYSVNANLSYLSKPFKRFYGDISFNCSPENVDVLEAESLAVLKQFLKEGPTKKEVANVKKNWLLKRKKSLENNSFWFNLMYNRIYRKQKIVDISDYEEKLNDISAKFIKKIANKYIGKPSYTAKLLPEKKEEVIVE
ncbi:insulinase family protein [uncultured Polaribacter sp.]|uniref:M16 family metallopeptidase n=1 Tax=uncultured Polaribacter sp. TaxID=174711 RepID=UPI002634398B|nr:insulinase family protein [uncultured Polaribacter sp.]